VIRRIATALVVIGTLAVPAIAAGRVLRVGTYKGIAGQYKTIQAAVNAATPGDWILVGPGDYKTTSSTAPTGHPDFVAGVLIQTPNIYLRGMNRNTVIVDGTRSGGACSSKSSDQNFGPNLHGKPSGLNGVEVYKANNVWVENLTSCNFLGGSGGDGHTGNEIWWNGGADSGKVGASGYYGSYLTATSQFYNNETTAAAYGIFSSNWDGGTWNYSYASNFNDSGYYIGACQQVCNQTIDHAHAEFNALGYSGTNSGGRLMVENSEFDNNEDGFDTNSQNADFPPPQNGSCPNGGTSSITHTHSCWVFINNYVHDNNNPNVPSSGSAAAGPVGTGMSISGGRNDTIMHNRFVNNRAWGIILVPYLDSGPPCTGGTLNAVGSGSCLYDEFGDAVIDNTFTNNGSYGHPTNGDIGQLNFEGGHPTNCASGNEKSGGGAATTSPANLESTHPKCDGSAAAANPNPAFLGEVLCDSQVSLSPPAPPACPSGPYPRRTKVEIHPLPSGLATMTNPCKDVPYNPWCKAPNHKPGVTPPRGVCGSAVDAVRPHPADEFLPNFRAC
jgi:hypothetical protein